MQCILTARYVWHGMKKDIRTLCSKCADCQASKITRHVHSTVENPPAPTERFTNIHVDLVGPLTTSTDGMSYMLTAIDSFTRWPEIFPIPDIRAKPVAQTFVTYRPI